MTDSPKTDTSMAEPAQALKPKTIPEREQEILEFWNEKKIFQKSLELPAFDAEGTLTGAPRKEFVFYDGPPFATGLPHYGHMLPGTVKDVIPRYQTMKGKHVARRWGWDCHGLPIENLVQKELNLPTKKDIEEYGIERFNAAASATVLRYFEEWKEIIPRAGRWVDMEDYYKTMDPSYTESVWWSWKAIYDKGLASENFKILYVCPHCETTLSNTEVSQNYKDVTDISVYAKFELVDEPNAFLVAWTTTPWTLPGNTALALNRDIEYSKVRFTEADKDGMKDEGIYVIATKLLEKALKDKKYEVAGTVSGADLIGKTYRPVFGYYANAELEHKDNIYKVWHADFVTDVTGTGIAHQAPAFGADDLALARANGIPMIVHVNLDGTFKPEVTDLAGMKVKAAGDTQSADVEIIKLLAHRAPSSGDAASGFSLLFAKEKIIHSYPHCWRCDTPLLNYATSSWFVNVTKFKEKLGTNLIEANKAVKWVPEEIGEGRFGKWLESEYDWGVSRARFWGTPIPVWKSPDGKAVEILGSLADLKARTRRNRYIIMRHGESEHNVLGILSSKAANPHHLTEAGRMVVEATADLLDKESIDVIFTSPFVRTRETADIVVERRAFKGEVVVDDRLGEFNFGDYDGRQVEEYHRYFDSLHEKLTKRMPNGENLYDVRKRVGDFLYDIDSRYEGKHILIITHDSPATVLEVIAEGGDGKRMIDMWSYTDDFVNPGEVRRLDFAVIPHDADYELDYHRPYIDEISWVAKEGIAKGQKMTRIPDVFDTWYDSGCVPFASRHYPFENKEKFDEGETFPADFIAESIDQTRGWFYSTLALGVALFGRSPYRQVVVSGVVLAEDGRKMSKSLKNYPDLLPTIQKYGADALRYFLMSSPAVHGEEISFSEKALDDVVKKNFNRLLNVASFYDMYGGASEAKIGNGTALEAPASAHVLDQWIVARLNEVATTMTASLDAYQIDKAIRPIADFIDDLSVWYIRRSRDRFKSDDAADRQAALRTTRYALLQFSILMAPFLPFLAEDIYKKMGGSLESVHLERWPDALVSGDAKESRQQAAKGIIADMTETRRLVSLALEARAKSGIKVRQPLGELKVRSKLAAEFLQIIGEEVNVKTVSVDHKMNGDIVLDTELTAELREEGFVRELVRVIQDTRKALGFDVADRPTLTLSADNSVQKTVEKYRATLLSGASLSCISFKDLPNTEVYAIGESHVSFDLAR